jgi:hypothetical protein
MDQGRSDGNVGGLTARPRRDSQGHNFRFSRYVRQDVGSGDIVQRSVAAAIIGDKHAF